MSIKYLEVKKLTYDTNQAGAHSFITREPRLVKPLTDRPNTALRVFFEPLVGKLKNYNWGYPFPAYNNIMTTPKLQRSRLLDATLIQNILAIYDLAPRVYGLPLLKYEGKLYPTQIVEDLGEQVNDLSSSDRTALLAKIEKIANNHGIETDYLDAGQVTNFIQNKFVDFQGWKLRPEYLPDLIYRYENLATWSNNTYQSVPELNIQGRRDNQKRVQLLGLETIDHKDKYVLDIGTSGGFFARYAAKKGAKRVTGIDLPEVAKITAEVSYYLGYHNIDYLGLHLHKDEQVKVGYTPDIIYYLSMNRYLHDLPILATAKTLIYEHNGDEPAEVAIERLAKHYTYIEDLGDTGTETGAEDTRHSYILKK